MTVTYSLNVANAKLTGFSKLLIRWKGSIYKLLYREMMIFCTLYYALSILYRYILDSTQRVGFEKVSLYCEAFTNMVPLTFVLGFYVSIVVARWWEQFMQIPWPDKCVMLIVGNVHGSDERGRMIRRTMARYLILLMTLTCQAVSTSVRRRFPTLDHIVEAGIMTKEERIVYDQIPSSHGKWWAPAVWFTTLAVRARKEGRIKDDVLLRQLLDELQVYRLCCGMMFAYDWISIPLVYTQTVTIATYTYFLAKIMGSQYLDPTRGYSHHEVDLYIPVFTIFEFFFFMGWLKVAEQLINPYGEDDDDFELNWCLDRNLIVCFWIVDDMYNKHPKLVRDMYWDDLEPTLPYTKASASTFRAMGASKPHIGSAMNLEIDPDDTEFLPMETIMEEDHYDNTYNSAPGSAGGDTVINSNGFILSNKDKDGESVGRQSNKVEADSNKGLRLFPDSFRDSLRGSFRGSFRGSRIFNMIMGQSNENINSMNKDKGDGHKEQDHVSQTSNKPMNVPFILRTPKKRTRTTSVGDGTRPTLHPAASAATITNNLPGSNRNSKIILSGEGYPDVPTAPIILSGQHHSRRGTPSVDRRRIGAAQDAHDNSNISRMPGADGFRFPSAYVPSHSQSQQGYYQDIPNDSNNLNNDDEEETPRIRSGPDISSDRTNNNTMSRASSVRSYAPSEPVILTIGTPSTPGILGSSEPLIISEADLYEPDLNPEEVNLISSVGSDGGGGGVGNESGNGSSIPTPGTDGSDDSDSNQNTVRSFSELLKQSSNSTKKDE